MGFRDLFSRKEKEITLIKENDASKRRVEQTNSSTSKPLSSPQLRQPTSNQSTGYSYTDSRRASPPASRVVSPSSNSQSSAKPAGGYSSLFSNIAKEGMSNKENQEFLQKKFPNQSGSSTVPLGSSTNPQINKIISNSANASSSPRPSSSSSSSVRSPGMGSLLSSMAKESIAFQEEKKKGFVQAFGPTPRDQTSSSSSPARSSSPPSSPALRTPSSSSSYSAPRAPNAKQAGISGLFSSMAQESIAYQEEKKKGFVQSFGPTPREQGEPVVAAIIRPSSKTEEKKEKPELSKRDIVWLSEMTKSDVLIGGGKGANLAEMYNLKLPVPPAFVITAKAYQDFIEQTGLKQRILDEIAKIDIENTAQLEAKAQELREMIIATPMPREISEQIIESYDDLSLDREVAERASQSVLSMIKSAREPSFVAIRSSVLKQSMTLIAAGRAFMPQRMLEISWKNRMTAH